MNDRTKKSNNEYIENIMINMNRLDIYLCSNVELSRTKGVLYSVQILYNTVGEYNRLSDINKLSDN
jgi:hypothetical protein